MTLATKLEHCVRVLLSTRVFCGMDHSEYRLMLRLVDRGATAYVKNGQIHLR